MNILDRFHRKIFSVLLLTTCVFVSNLSDAHKARLAGDGCHNSNEFGTHCHEADETIDFISNESGYYVVSDITDGDTLDLVYGQGLIKIRLFGVDTPETKKGTKLTADVESILKEKGVPLTDAAMDAEKANQLKLGRAARAYVEETLSDKQIYVLFDNTNQFPFILPGKYGRYLAYIFYREAGGTRFLNIDLIANGHADLDYVDTPFRYRWAFVSDLDEIQERFHQSDLPAPENLSVAPSIRQKLTTTWAVLKVKNHL